MSQLKRRRRDLLRDAEAEDEREFRQRVARHAEAKSLRDRRIAVEREIGAAIGGHCAEEVIGEKLEAGNLEELPRHLTRFKARFEENGLKLRQRLEERGRLVEQLHTLAEDRLPAAKRLELATVEKRLNEAIFRWQVRAVAGRMLDGVRSIYERDRQPETLREASLHLEQLTGGRYNRVWTPLGEEVLRVDDAEGRSLTVDMLSQGVREQLFLCLRLSLLSSFERRGAVLPMVLDDVLVNFDAKRAKATVRVLRDFAAAGHQMFVFTCHEHIVKLFKSLHVPVRRLPDNREMESSSVTDRETPKKRSGRKKPPPITPVKEEIAKAAEEEPELSFEAPLPEDEFAEDREDEPDDEYEDEDAEDEDAEEGEEESDEYEEEEEDEYEDDEDDEDDEYEDEAEAA